MKPAKQPEPTGKSTAIVASVVGLALVWSIILAHVPSRDELLSAQPNLGPPTPPPVPELDLSIPGVPSARPGKESGRMGGQRSPNTAGRGGAPAVSESRTFSK